MSSLGILAVGGLLSCLLGGGDLDGAEKALAAGKPNDALERLGDLADVDGASLRALLVQGRAYLRLREYEGAVEALLRGHELAPDNRALARDATLACWYAAADAGAYASAYMADAKRLSKHTGDARLMADVHYFAGDHAAALRHYGDVPDKDKTRLFLRERRALCLRALSRADEARTAYGLALEEALRVKNLGAAFRTAFAARQQGRFLGWLDKRLQADSSDVEARRYRGYARAAVLRYADAATDLRAVLKKRPDDLAIKKQLTSVLLRVGVDTQTPAVLLEAESLGLGVLAQQPDDRATWNGLNWLAGWYWANRDVKSAYGLLGRLVAIDETDFDTGLNFGAMARRLGHLDAAKAVYTRLLELAPNDSDVLNDLAILRDGQGDRTAAVQLWRRVLEVDQNNLNALENLLTAAWERGDLARANELVPRGLTAARRPGGPLQRWEWFRDRLEWCSKGFGR